MSESHFHFRFFYFDENRKVLPSVKPTEIPEQLETWKKVLKDIDDKVLAFDRRRVGQSVEMFEMIHALKSSQPRSETVKNTETIGQNYRAKGNFT